MQRAAILEAYGEEDPILKAQEEWMASRDERIRADRVAAEKGATREAEPSGSKDDALASSQRDGSGSGDRSVFGGPKVRPVNVREIQSGPQGLFINDGTASDALVAASASGGPQSSQSSDALALANRHNADRRGQLRDAVVAGSEFSAAEMEGSYKAGTPRSVVDAINRRMMEGRRLEEREEQEEASAADGSAGQGRGATAIVPPTRDPKTSKTRRLRTKQLR